MSKNLHVSLQNKPKKSTTYCKSKGNQKFQMSLSRNYDFVFTNLLKNEAAMLYFLHSEKSGLTLIDLFLKTSRYYG